MKAENKSEKMTLPRHNWLVRIEHWIIAVSGFLLVFSGFGQFPLYKRYMVDKLPSLGWSSNFALELRIHYLAAIFFTAAVVFHLVYHSLRRETSLVPRKGDLRESWQIIRAMFGKGEEPPSDKFLAEQRLAYVVFGGGILLLVITGLIKTARNFPGISLSPGFTIAITTLHNLGTILFLGSLAAHVLALVIKPNRPLLAGIFTGRIDAEYARHRHSLWETVGTLNTPPEEVPDPDGTAAAPGSTPGESGTAAGEPASDTASVVEDEERDDEGEKAYCYGLFNRYS